MIFGAYRPGQSDSAKEVQKGILKDSSENCYDVWFSDSDIWLTDKRLG